MASKREADAGNALSNLLDLLEHLGLKSAADSYMETKSMNIGLGYMDEFMDRMRRFWSDS
jgi:hypothetical protein